MALSPEAEFQLRKAERQLRAREDRRARLLTLAGLAARVLRSEFGASGVWLFGSALRPWFHEGSDLDLAVEGVATERLGAAWDRVSELIGERVDLVAMEDADDGLKRRILQSGERLSDVETAG